jgi:Recombinase zinc beta ribbon domain/Recombinase
MRVLKNPRYAGAYVYGRGRYRRGADGKMAVQRKHDSGDCLACIPDAHPGYISWEQYQQNLKLLESNGRGYALARSSPPREGAALLQGRAVCGRCGRYFRLTYSYSREKPQARYICDPSESGLGEPNCQSIAASPVDEAIGALVTERMTPAAVELALEIRREIEARHEEADQLRCRAIEHAQYEADLAQRRFMLVDPANRLVAGTLEAAWNDKLRVLAQAREERERARQQDQLLLDDAIRQRLITMTTDFRRIWNDPDTPNRERKRLLAYIIEDVTLVKLPEEGTIRIHVRFKGGKTETLIVLSPRNLSQLMKTPPPIVELVDRLLDDHIYDEIAGILNAQGLHPGGSARPGRSNTCFTAQRVAYLVREYGLRSRYDRLRDRGYLTHAQAAARLGVHEWTVEEWAKRGLIKRHACNGHWYLYELPESGLPIKPWHRHSDGPANFTPGEKAEPSDTLERSAV